MADGIETIEKKQDGRKKNGGKRTGSGRKPLLDKAEIERVEKQTRVRILDAIRTKLPETLSRPDLEMVALDYFRRLGHDNHRRVSKLYAWEEKKSKTSWGGQAVDYEKIATAAVLTMKTADVHRFLVVCPGYNPKQSLARDTNLARTAVRYKMDLAKVGSTVRAELTKIVPFSRDMCTPTSSSRSVTATR